MKRLLIVGALAFPFGAVAEETFRPTPAEMGRLPPFCAERIEKGSSAKGSPAADKLGKDNWIHIHHYCFGLNFFNRAMAARNPKDRATKLVAARNNFEVVIRATEPRFWMRPQIYVEAGRVELQLKSPESAERLFRDAIEFNPEYLPAYHALVDLYRESGRNKEALEVATGGLRHLPDSEPLKKAYLDLGGKQPFPEPVRKTGSVAEGEAREEAKSQEPSPDMSAQPGKEGTSAASVPNPPVSEPGPETGCRFCPPQDVQQRWRDSFKGGRQ